jgi:hypothetical protein
MKRTHILDYEISSTAWAWPVSVGISRNERTRLWTLYVQYDGDCLYSNRYTELLAGNIPYVLEENHYHDLKEFCHLLESTRKAELVELAAELRLGFSDRETKADVASFGTPEESEMREAFALCEDRHDREAE